MPRRAERLIATVKDVSSLDRFLLALMVAGADGFGGAFVMT